MILCRLKWINYSVARRHHSTGVWQRWPLQWREMTSSISSHVRIWKIRHYGPGCSFVWILRVVYFPVKHSRLYNKSWYYQRNLEETYKIFHDISQVRSNKDIVIIRNAARLCLPKHHTVTQPKVQNWFKKNDIKNLCRTQEINSLFEFISLFWPYFKIYASYTWPRLSWNWWKQIVNDD